MRVRVRTVSVMRSGGNAVIADANEDDTTVSVRQTHDRIHELVVAQRPAALGDEFGGELLAARNEPAKVRVGQHNLGDWCRERVGVGKVPDGTVRSTRRASRSKIARWFGG